MSSSSSEGRKKHSFDLMMEDMTRADYARDRTNTKTINPHQSARHSVPHQVEHVEGRPKPETNYRTQTAPEVKSKTGKNLNQK
jgi:hypothetical protein